MNLSFKVLIIRVEGWRTTLFFCLGYYLSPVVLQQKDSVFYLFLEWSHRVYQSVHHAAAWWHKKMSEHGSIPLRFRMKSSSPILRWGLMLGEYMSVLRRTTAKARMKMVSGLWNCCTTSGLHMQYLWLWRRTRTVVLKYKPDQHQNLFKSIRLVRENLAAASEKVLIKAWW